MLLGKLDAHVQKNKTRSAQKSLRLGHETLELLGN